MQAYEYRVTQLMNELEMNKMGMQGFELVQVVAIPVQTQPVYKMYWKRTFSTIKPIPAPGPVQPV